MTVLTRLPAGRLSMLLGALLITVFVLVLDAGRRTFTAAQAKPPRPPLDYYANNAEIQVFDVNGQRVRRLNAPEARHETASDLLLLTSPVITVEQARKPVWTATSAHAETRMDSDEVLMTGEVRVRRLADGTVLGTERLTVMPERQYAETDLPVIITSPQGQTHATGMRAWLDRETIKLLSEVKGHYDAP